MKIFYAYQLKEFAKYTLFIFSILLFFIALIRGIFTLLKIIYLPLTFTDIIILFLTSAGEVSAFTLLFSSFLSILFVVQRMKYERELFAFFSLGYRIFDFFKVLSLWAFLLFLFLLILSIVVVPWSKRSQKNLMIKYYENLTSVGISERVPLPIGEHIFLYTRKVENDNKTKLTWVFLLEDSAEKKGVYLAKEGVLAQDKGQLELKKGYVFFRETSDEIGVINFDNYQMNFRMDALKKEEFYIKRGEMSLKELSHVIAKEGGSKKAIRYMAELYNRFFFPVNIFPLLLHAFILSLIVRAPHRVLLFLLGSTYYFTFFGIYNLCSSFAESGKLNPLYPFLFFEIFMVVIIVFSLFYLKKRGATYL